MTSHMIMTLVYDGARYLALWVSYTDSLIADAIRAPVPMEIRSVNAHLRPLVALSFHMVGSGITTSTMSTKRLRQSQIRILGRVDTAPSQAAMFRKHSLGWGEGAVEGVDVDAGAPLDASVPVVLHRPTLDERGDAEGDPL